MKFMDRGSDGGKKSGVTGFWIIEIKWLFSIVLLRFNTGTRENYHSHAFNALTIWLKGNVVEDVWGSSWWDGKHWPAAGRFKWTPRTSIHRVRAIVPTYCLSFRGPWKKSWFEINPVTNERITMTSGRTVVSREPLS